MHFSFITLNLNEGFEFDVLSVFGKVGYPQQVRTGPALNSPEVSGHLQIVCAHTLMQGCHGAKLFSWQGCAQHCLRVATERLRSSKTLEQMFIPVPLRAFLLIHVPNSSQVYEFYW